MSLVKYQIPARHRNCCKQEEPFEEDDFYVSVLHYRDKNYERSDYCLSCWENLAEEFHSAIHWKSQVPRKKKVEDLGKDRNEKALNLLKQIHSEDEETKRVEAYFLALLLVRSKLLKLRQEHADEEGALIQLYEVIASEEMLPVHSVDIETINVAEVQGALAEQLKPVELSSE